MRTTFIIALFSLFSSFCYGQLKTTYTVEAIDSTTLNMYYLYTLIDKNNNEIKVISEKSNNDVNKGIIIDIGDTLILYLEKVIDVKVDSNNIIRVGSSGLFVSETKVCESGEYLFISESILGRYYDQYNILQLINE